MSRRAAAPLAIMIAALFAFGPAVAQDRTTGTGSLAPPPPDPTAASADADLPEVVMPDMDPKARKLAKEASPPADPAKPASGPR